MKKTLFISIIFAGLIITSCSKKESTISNTNLANTVDFLDGHSYNQTPTSICCWWYHWELEQGVTGSDGCDSIHPTDTLCYLKIGCGEENSIAATIETSPTDIATTRIRIHNYVGLPSKYSSWLTTTVSKGFITIIHDCPIFDDAVISQCNTDYIPAGTYNIINDNGDAVIIL